MLLLALLLQEFHYLPVFKTDRCRQPKPGLNVQGCVARKTTLVISFMSRGFPNKDPIEELFIAMVSFCVFPTCNSFNFLALVSISLSKTYCLKA